MPYQLPDVEQNPNNCTEIVPTGQVYLKNAPVDGDYRVEWIYDNKKFNGDTLKGIKDGLVEYSIRFGNQCDYVGSIEVEDNSLKIIEDGVNILPDCGGEKGEVEIIVSGGTGDYMVYSPDGKINHKRMDPETLISVATYGASIQIKDVDDEDCVLNYEPPVFEVTFDLPDTIKTAAEEVVNVTARIIPDDLSRKYKLKWTPSEADDLARDYNLSFIAVESTLVTVDVKDENGCTGSDDVFILINKNEDIKIPNAFSPNGDGINDILKVFPGSSVKPIKSFQMYDRYGMLIWEQSDISLAEAEFNRWDGTYGGRPVMPDVYFAVADVEYIDGQIIRYVTDVTLVK